MATPPLVAWMNPLPMEVAPALVVRRRSLAARAHGRVLDLGGWADHLGSYRLGAAVDSVVMLDQPADVRAGTGRDDPLGVTRLEVGVDVVADIEPGPFDSIVSLIRTPLVADFDRFIGTLLSLLADEGSLYFLEPVRRDGRLGRLVALAGMLGRAAGGLHLDRDLPAELRGRGLVVTDLSRFEVPTLSAPMRPFIEAVARRPVSFERSSPSR